MARGSGYLALVLFVAANSTLFLYGAVLEHGRHADFKRYTGAVARGTGYMLNLDCGLLLLLGSRVFLSLLRRTFLNQLLSFDDAMPRAHVAVGYTCLGAAVVHGIFHFVPGVAAGSWQSGFLGWNYAVATGAVLLLTFLTMTFYARESTRRARFELFYYVHLAGAVLFFILLAMHGLLFGKLYTYKWIAGFVVIYAADRAYRRFIQTCGAVDLCGEGTVSFFGDVIRLRLPRAFSDKAGQWAELCIPELSDFQYHPFTIASCPDDPYITFFIKSSGDWTESLQQLLRERVLAAERGDQALEYRMRGPFGAPAEHVGQYSRVVLVSAGVGSTPFLSVVRDFMTRTGEAVDKTSPFAESLPSCDSGVSLQSSLPSSVDLTEEEEARVASSMDPWSARTKLNRLSNIGRKTTFFVPKIPPPTLNSFEELSDNEDYVTTFFQRVHFYLSSTTVSYASLFLSFARLWICGLVVIYRVVPTDGGPRGTEAAPGLLFQALPRGFCVADLVFAILLLAHVTIVVVLDILLRPHEIPLWARAVDLGVVIPILAAPVVLYDLTFSGRPVKLALGRGVNIDSHDIFWLLGFLAIVYRFVRNGSPFTVLASYVGKEYERTKSMDFIYATPNSASDEWLVRELELLPESKKFRLHRFLTREEPDSEGASDHRWGTNFGRPDFDDIFEQLVLNCKGCESVGVFLCGNKSFEMNVRKACLRAMTRSRRRGSYFSGRSSRRGCNVRLLVRAENF